MRSGIKERAVIVRICSDLLTGKSMTGTNHKTGSITHDDSGRTEKLASPRTGAQTTRAACNLPTATFRGGLFTKHHQVLSQRINIKSAQALFKRKQTNRLTESAWGFPNTSSRAKITSILTRRKKEKMHLVKRNPQKVLHKF